MAREARGWGRGEPRGTGRSSETTFRGSPSPPSGDWLAGGAVKRISGLIYEETRGVLKVG